MASSTLTLGLSLSSNLFLDLFQLSFHVKSRNGRLDLSIVFSCESEMGKHCPAHYRHKSDPTVYKEMDHRADHPVDHPCSMTSSLDPLHWLWGGTQGTPKCYRVGVLVRSRGIDGFDPLAMGVHKVPLNVIGLGYW